MMLSKDDREWVKLISREVAFKVNKEVLAEHIKTCPHGKSILITKCLLVGVCIGSGLISSGVAIAVARLIIR